MAGTIKADVIQLGDSGTADNNFFLKTNGDGSASLVRGNNPTGTNILTVSAAGKVNIESSVLQSATSQASTSGTSIDFTGIPSWARRITVMFQGVSTSGTSQFLIQLGTGTAPNYTTSGYAGQANNVGGVSAMSIGFIVSSNVVAANNYNGIITLATLGGNSWAESGTLMQHVSTTNGTFSGGSVTLSEALTAVRITTVNGTDTFDAGSINIMWE